MKGIHSSILPPPNETSKSPQLPRDNETLMKLFHLEMGIESNSNESTLIHLRVSYIKIIFVLVHGRYKSYITIPWATFFATPFHQLHGCLMGWTPKSRAALCGQPGRFTPPRSWATIHGTSACICWARTFTSIIFQVLCHLLLEERIINNIYDIINIE